MNECIRILPVVTGISVLTSTAMAGVTTYRATTDDRHHIEGHGYSKTGETETFMIDSADRPKGQRLTPRVERWFAGKGAIEKGKGVYTFSASYKIDAANDTTIFQLLNHDPKSDDAHKPLCFITVFPSEDGTKWDIHKGNKTDTPLLASVAKADSFKVKLQTDGTRWLVWINGRQAADGAFSREGKSTSMRYGAYHHGKGLAKVHVIGAGFELDSDAKMPPSSP